jgi:Domain of unknown function (DUF4328)/Protein of unknown function (DUF2510)
MQPFAPSPYAYAAPGSTEPAKRLDGLARAAAGALAVVVVACLYATYAYLHRNGAANHFVDLGRPRASDLQPLQDADDTVRIATVLVGLAAFVSWILWVSWAFQYGRNAERLGGKGGLSPVFAIVGWIIPLGSWLLPPLQLSTAAKGSDPAAGPGAPASRGKAPVVIWLWWLAYLVGLGLFVGGTSERPNTEDVGTTSSARASLGDFASADRLVGIAAIVLALAAVLAIAVVLGLNKRQGTRIDATAAAGVNPAYGSGRPAPGFGPPVGAGIPPQPASAGFGQPSPGFAQPPSYGQPVGPGGPGSPSYGQAAHQGFGQPGGSGGAAQQPQPQDAPPAPGFAPPGRQQAPAWGAPQPAKGPDRPAANGGFTVPGGSPAAAAPVVPPVGVPSNEPGWHPDPFGEAGLRWWDGRQWTNHISGQPRQ